MKRLFFLALLLIVCRHVTAQETFRVMFYNTENFFDCRHDTLKNDYEFLPHSMRAWHEGRYKRKLYHTAQVIAAVGEWDAPALVGLCEVENEKVMNDLVKYSPLKEYRYQYVMTDSPDERGIDVALMWQRDRFRLLYHRPIRIHWKEGGRKPTRDLLHVVGRISTGDSLDVFVCHMPSRSGGEKESEPARLFTASVLKHAVDSLYAIRLHPNILIMGDFNDYPENSSIAGVLAAGVPRDPVDAHRLYNLMADKGTEIGTYNYKGEWGILDHFLVSGFLLQHTGGLHTGNRNAHICDFPFLLEENPAYGGKKPFRTYYGMRYTGGFSDHLPITVDFVLP